ncbi:hypothetical protein EYC80_006066 [Monilinia laxa]|nr:hypothetical protein EYC80_006066 [Monilinia laxa]
MWDDDDDDDDDDGYGGAGNDMIGMGMSFQIQDFYLSLKSSSTSIWQLAIRLLIDGEGASRDSQSGYCLRIYIRTYVYLQVLISNTSTLQSFFSLLFVNTVM